MASFSGNTKRRKTRQQHTMKFMIFYLICLACSNDLSTRPFCFLSFSSAGHYRALRCAWSAAFSVLHSTPTNSVGELRLGRFRSLASEAVCQTDHERESFDHTFDQLLSGSGISSNCKPVFSNWKIRFLLVATIL